MNDDFDAWWNALDDDPTAHAEEIKNEFAVQVAQALRREQISQQQLAERMGVTPAYVSRLLRGDENASIATMTKVAYHLSQRVHIRLAPADSKGWWSYDSRRVTTQSAAQPQTDRSHRPSEWFHASR